MKGKYHLVLFSSMQENNYIVYSFLFISNYTMWFMVL